MLSKSLELQTKREQREGKAQNRRHTKLTRERETKLRALGRAPNAVGPYPAVAEHVAKAPRFIEQALTDPDVFLPSQVRQMAAVARALEPKDPSPEDLRILRLWGIRVRLQDALKLVDELF